MRTVDDIPPRYEHKFMLTAREAAVVRARIAPFCVLDPHSQASPTSRYVITSLYLDSPDLQCYRAWELGEAHRFKLRVRRYGQVLGDSPVFIEVKERIHDIIVKRRQRVAVEDWLASARDGRGRSVAEQDFTARALRTRAAPVLLVRYEREAYKGRLESYARLTFDSHLQYARCESWDLEASGSFSSEDDPAAIGELDPRVLLEVKFEREIPRWMVALLRELELVRRGLSKYGLGMVRAFGQDRLLDEARREPTGPDRDASYRSRR